MARLRQPVAQVLDGVYCVANLKRIFDEAIRYQFVGSLAQFVTLRR
jgi:hypothetical protein